MSDTTAENLRLVFMGTPAFAATILEMLLRWEGGEVVGVFTQPGPKNTKCFLNLFQRTQHRA